MREVLATGGVDAELVAFLRRGQGVKIVVSRTDTLGSRVARKILNLPSCM